MSQYLNELLLRVIYEKLLYRTPSDVELNHWLSIAESGLPWEGLLSRFIDSDEYKNKSSARLFYPPGHYYSPIVDPRDIVRNGRIRRDVEPSEIAGIDLSIERMRTWWAENSEIIASTPFPEHEAAGFRYYSENPIFPIGDAVTLRAMIARERPRRIVEIGSGFSSACALDSIDEFKLPTKMTLVEPYTERLMERLRPSDMDRVDIIESGVQDVDIHIFTSLEIGDILFIDSTHILKTGSDVNFELFRVLPLLRSGVMVHFHDMHYPFEYPDDWIITKNLSWNEIYAVRAFLMYNDRFKIDFMNHMFGRFCSEEIRSVFPRFARNVGGSLWLRKVAGQTP